MQSEAYTMHGGGDHLISDSIYASAMENPNYNYFMPNNSFQSFSNAFPKEENGLLMARDMENGYGSEQADREKSVVNDEAEISDGAPTKRKRYHRHTAQQIQEMELLFRDCPHPDDKQRLKLSRELGLKPRQVKFWFQNRRTQMKAQNDRADNNILRAENDSLKNENYRLQSELRSIVCPNCGGQAVPGVIPFGDMRLENARLREELGEALSLISRFTGRPVQALMRPDPALLPPPPLDMDTLQQIASNT